MAKPIKHQPRFSEDPKLDKPIGKHYYKEYADLLERYPGFLEYPETRALPGAGNYLPVFPDEFIGTNPAGGGAIPNATMPEVTNPSAILGDALANTDGKFNKFLADLRQLCRNYNLDLYRLRQELFLVRKTPGHLPDNLPHLISEFNKAADTLSKFMAAHDPDSPDKVDPFGELAVEFVKINNYIASIRAAAVERGRFPVEKDNQIKEVQFSSSSHISISSMFSSYSSPSGSSSSSTSSSP